MTNKINLEMDLSLDPTPEELENIRKLKELCEEYDKSREGWICQSAPYNRVPNPYLPVKE